MAADKTIADAKPNNWVDRWVPGRLKYLFRLGRFDRPIGIWLLLWPCWWGVLLATPADMSPDFTLFALFAAGAVAMRSAGCAYNDIVDRDFDAMVERTGGRPLASGNLTLLEGYLFTTLMGFIGLWVLINFNAFTIWLGMASLVLVGIYPFMKRVTYWPQAVLGLTFNWGALMGYAAITGTLALEAFFLYAAGFFWTLGYDTVYAHQDKEDDILVGVKSSALKLGENTASWLFVFYGLMIGFLLLTGIQAGLSLAYYSGLLFMALQLLWQVYHLRIDSPETCLRIFKSNFHIGWMVLASLALGKWL